MRSVRGFTLVELLVTIAVLAIILAIAVPNFSTLIRQNRAQTQINLLVNALNLARSEAITRGTTVHVSSLNGGNWRQGWRVWIDINNDGVVANGKLLRAFPALEGANTLTSAVTQVVFDSHGRLSGAVAGTNVEFAYNVGTGFCKYERIITINAVGRTAVRPKECN
ncbi:type IV fimbrial biogenesis protein FimT [Pseudomonas duriflava]|uniref:Type II secretion system protein H n=1 Tax=Pseudomonas duriflava TaxID=459528 RepID=A0A562QC58_9PSED|nr:GspH/FimT family pseudopilin [Pseudomonas duriflava]TWI54328.1 type IV fimbrial biogenesis protein FimT [Pseudomonas duriflava]